MNLGDLRTRVLENLGDDGAVWAPSDIPGTIERLINDAQRELAVLAERVDPTFNVKSIGLPIAGESWAQLDVVGYLPAHIYTPLPSDFRRIISLWQAGVGIGGPYREVQIIPRRRAMFYDGLGVVGDSTVVYLQNEKGSGSTGPTNRIYVIGSSVGNYTWSLWYAARLTDLSEAYDECQLPEEYHHLVALGATVKALLQENGEAGNYKVMYDQAVQTMAATLPRRDGAGAPY